MANAPQSRKEAYLAAIAGVPGIDKPMTPQSREEEYLGLIADHVINNDVIANPTLAGTEANLTSVQIDGTKYAVPQGTPVTANPTLAGGETALTGLQVGDTKYAVPQGGSTHLYQHTIYLYTWVNNDRIDIAFNLYKESSTPITESTLKNAIKAAYPDVGLLSLVGPGLIVIGSGSSNEKVGVIVTAQTNGTGDMALTHVLFDGTIPQSSQYHFYDYSDITTIMDFVSQIL